MIVGAGFIACEFACILHGLGVQVTQLVRGEQILRGFDREAALVVQEAMQAEGTVSDADLACFQYVDTPEQAWAVIKSFHLDSR